MTIERMECEHSIPLTDCGVCYPFHLKETTVGEVLGDRVYGRSKAWRDAADQLLYALAENNRFIVSDMVVMFLESSGYGLSDYSPLGGVFKRAAKRGIIKRVQRNTKQALWYSKIYPERIDL